MSKPYNINIMVMSRLRRHNQKCQVVDNKNYTVNNTKTVTTIVLLFVMIFGPIYTVYTRYIVVIIIKTKFQGRHLY